MYLDPDIRIYDSLASSLGARGATRHRADAAHDAAVSAGRLSGEQLLHPRGGRVQPRIRRRRRVGAAVSRLVVAVDAARGAERRVEDDVHRPAVDRLRPVPLRAVHPEGSRLQRRVLEPARACADARRRSLQRRRRAAAVLPLQRIRRREAVAPEPASGRSAARAPERSAAAAPHLRTTTARRCSRRASAADAGRRYGWGTLACGVEFTEAMRRLYRSALVEAEQGNGPEPPDPFDEARPDAFVAWLNSPDEAGPRRVSRYLYQIYRAASISRCISATSTAPMRSAYLDWIRRDGVVQAHIPPELLPERRAPESVDAREPPSARRGRQHRRLLPSGAGHRRSGAPPGERGRGGTDPVLDDYDRHRGAEPPGARLRDPS